MNQEKVEVEDPDQVVQVRLRLLDRLMDLAGELVLGRNQLLQWINVSNLEGIKATAQRIDMITSELQETIMKTRNLPNAIIPCQIVQVGRERFALPQDNLNELIRIPGEQVRDRLQRVGDAEVFQLRGEIFPLLNLAALLRIEQEYPDPQTGKTLTERRENLADRRSGQDVPPVLQAQQREPDPEREVVQRKESDRRIAGIKGLNIAVVSDCGFKYGLVVDRFLETEEVVVKSMGRHLGETSVYAGATIMGDGKVSLILDVLGLARTAGLSRVSEAVQVLKSTGQAGEGDGAGVSLLTFRNGQKDHFAVPLDLVRRIERIQFSNIEDIGDRKVVQYRGGSLQLFELSQILDIESLPKGTMQEVIVLSTQGRELGLMVTGPVDALETVLDLDETTMKGPGVRGSLIINHRTTLLLEVEELAKIVLSL
ncbi:chemotaxis protein CheW [Desulfospira joergensenii]|uniref:chemotaxis protein CheW n=1 Tax=Desulfospira joergensenii TaxID=53329 RepID=UPI0006865EF7|nr:chemotaxis protein CheW [Desulfospira joergensenii]